MGPPCFGAVEGSKHLWAVKKLFLGQRERLHIVFDLSPIPTAKSPRVTHGGWQACKDQYLMLKNFKKNSLQRRHTQIFQAVSEETMTTEVILCYRTWSSCFPKPIAFPEYWIHHAFLYLFYLGLCLYVLQLTFEVTEFIVKNFAPVVIINWQKR